MQPSYASLSVLFNITSWFILFRFDGFFCFLFFFFPFYGFINHFRAIFNFGHSSIYINVVLKLLLWSATATFRLKFLTINLNIFFNHLFYFKNNNHSFFTAQTGMEYTERTKFWVFQLLCHITFALILMLYAPYENPWHALSVLLTCIKLFYTSFDGRAQKTNAKISSQFGTFLRFYVFTFLLRKIRFSLFKAFG